jgi:hypothetical protein
MNATTANWYLAKNGTKHGPYTAAQVKEFGEAGHITADMLAWRTGAAEWVSVSSVRGMRVAPVAEAATAVVVRPAAVTYRKASPYAPVLVFMAVTLGVAVGGFVAIEAAKQYAVHQVASVVRKSGEKFAASVDKEAAEWKQHHEQIQGIFAKANAAMNANAARMNAR